MRPRRLSASSAPTASSLYVNRLSSLIPGLLLVVLAAGLAKCALAEDKVTIEQMPPAVREGSARLTGHYNPAQTLRLVFALETPAPAGGRRIPAPDTGSGFAAIPPVSEPGAVEPALRPGG